MSWIRILNFTRLGQVAFVLYYTGHPAYMTYRHLYYEILINNCIWKSCIKNTRIKLYSVRSNVFCFLLYSPTCILYIFIIYYNWLSFNPSCNLVSWMWVQIFIQLGQVVFVVLHCPAYTTYKSFYYNWLIFNHIL